MTEKRRPKPHPHPLLPSPALSKEQLKPVYLSEPRWRALAAILHVARGIATDPTQATLFDSLYEDIQSQVNITIEPIEESE